ncbi:MAG: hypothetical protein J6U81_05410, partial [Bacteroidales bacterium]|nr:hypothetical protein [Bacteroidales bacterium]
KRFLNSVYTALIFAVVLVGLMFLINGIIGNGELNQSALIIPVCLSFIITTKVYATKPKTCWWKL